MKKEKNLSRRTLLSASAQVAAGAAAASLLPDRAGAQGKTKPKGSRSNPPSARFSNPPALSKPRGYSHVAEVINGRAVYIAGQVSLDKDGNLVGKDDFRAQCTQVFENLKAALESVGANFSHVVKLNNYFVDMSNLVAFREIRDKYVNAQSPPASTAVEVRKLAREEWLVEIEAVAIIPE